MHRQNRYEEILRAAADLFCRHGVQAVSTRQIAAAVGISQPSLYAHFQSVREIHEHVSHRAFSLLETYVKDTLTDDVNAHERLKKMIDLYLRFGLENPDPYRIAFMVEYPSEGGKPAAVFEHDHPGHRTFGMMQGAITAVRADLKPEQIASLAQSIWATMHGLLSLLIARPQFPWVDKERLMRQHADLAYFLVTRYHGDM